MMTFDVNPCWVGGGNIAICWVERLLECAREKRLDVEALLSAADISAYLLGSPNARISAEKFNVLWWRVALALGDEFLGQDSRGMKIGSFAWLCKTTIHCRTLKQALRRALRCFDLVLDDIRGELSLHEGLAKLTFQVRSHGGSAGILAYETLTMMLYGLACWLLDSAKFS